MTRCKSYHRGRGLYVYRGIRCDLAAGHAGRHIAAGRWLDPTACHRWGRGLWPTEADMQAGMPGQVRGLVPPSA